MNKLLNEEYLQSRLSYIGTGYKLLYEHELPSTNDRALSDYMDGKISAPAVYLCDVQTKGKGRLGRVWESREGSSLTFSVLMEPKCDLTSFPMLTEVYGLAACRAVRKICGCDALIKWPNDVVVKGRKICGILTEMSYDMKCVVIGSGFNILNGSYPKEMAEKAISLEEVSETKPDPLEILLGVLEEFDSLYRIFEETGNMKGLKEDYEALLINKGMRTGLKSRDGEIKGTALGIDDNGGLIFRKDDGCVINVTSGEVSVSGVYGCK